MNDEPTDAEPAAAEPAAEPAAAGPALPRLRRRDLLVGAAVLLGALALGGGLALVWRPGGGAAALPPEVSQVVVHRGGEPAEQPNVDAVTRLLTGLPAAFAAGRKDGLTAAAARQFADVRKALPPGSTVRVQSDTWRHAGQLGSVAVTVRPPRGAAQSYVVLLVRDGGGWKVSGTYPSAPVPSPSG